ncbi:ABC transporter permease [Candidatus Bathyarchaeota archaeon]|nr:ABC transporter permease [Candidatus Bathyarchaeota archaeon]
MEELIEGVSKAIQLIVSGDPIVLDITIRSLYVSGAAVLIATLWGIPIAILLGLKNFRGKLLIKGFFNALIGIPTVGLGLILYIFIHRTSFFGFLHLLYTPTAIIIGEAVLVTPIVVSFSANAMEAVSSEIQDLAKTLGASEDQAFFAVFREALDGILLAIVSSFNRAVAELGITQMVGGNIYGFTSVLTTTIANETAKGNISLSVALAIILFIILFGITLVVNLVQRRRK